MKNILGGLGRVAVIIGFIIFTLLLAIFNGIAAIIKTIGEGIAELSRK